MLPEVEALAGRVGIVRQGRLMAVAGVDELRRGARQRLQLHLGGPVGDDDVTRFRAVPEVVEVSARGPLVDLVVEGVVAGVVKVAAGMDVQRIVSHEADLEDVFLRFYEQEDR